MNGRICSRSYSCRTGLFALAALALFFCGPGEVRGQDLLVMVGEEWKFFRGTMEPPDNWNQLGFDDTAWEMGRSGFGYGDGNPATRITDMRNNYVSLYVRKVFRIDDPGQVKFPQLGIQYDDGFVAYVNGVEIGRRGLGADFTFVPFDATAASHEWNQTPEWLTFPADAKAALKAGDNVLAIQAHNTNLTSSDLVLIPQLRSLTSLCPMRFTCQERPDGSVLLRWRNIINPVDYESVEILRNGVVIGMPRTPRSTFFADTAPAAGINVYELSVIINGAPCGDMLPSCSVGSGASFRRGDADDNGMVNITDAVNTLLWLFQSGPPPTCPDAADADDDGLNSITDAVYLLLHLFQGGPEPPAPGTAACGVDATADDALVDCVYTSC